MRGKGIGHSYQRANFSEDGGLFVKNLHIACSPLTGTIFAGRVLRDGRTWAAGKKDVTIEALVAVAEHAMKFGAPVEISRPDGTVEYRITVERNP